MFDLKIKDKHVWVAVKCSCNYIKHIFQIFRIFVLTVIQLRDSLQSLFWFCIVYLFFFYLNIGYFTFSILLIIRVICYLPQKILHSSLA